MRAGIFSSGSWGCLRQHPTLSILFHLFGSKQRAGAGSHEAEPLRPRRRWDLDWSWMLRGLRPSVAWEANRRTEGELDVRPVELKVGGYKIG